MNKTILKCILLNINVIMEHIAVNFNIGCNKKKMIRPSNHSGEYLSWVFMNADFS